MTIPRLRIDSSGFEGELCRLGGAFGTDKSVLNTFVRSGQPAPHRHAYTPVYELLFATRRLERIHIAEIGIEAGAGIQMLRAYFPNADLIGFDANARHIALSEALGLAGVRYLSIDVRSAASIESAFRTAEGRFDIVIDDSTHQPEDQVRVIFPFLPDGGALIVEDVFESQPEEIFEAALEPLALDFAAFVLPEHPELAGGWKNDKLLVLVKGGSP